MLAYFLIFVLVGFGIGLSLKDGNDGGIQSIVMIAIGILWAFVFSSFWGIIAVFEMIIGMTIAKSLRGKISDNKKDDIDLF